MKRIIGTVVAFAAVLGFSTVSSAAYIAYNLAGATTYTSVSSSGVFSNGLGAGSYVTIQDDTNGDLTPGDVSIAAGTLFLNATFNLGALGTITPNTSSTIYGATGVLTGSTIAWDPGTTLLATTGTFQCTGAICGALSITEGVSYDISIFNAFSASLGNVTVNPSNLGTWNLAADLSAILSSSQHIVATNAAIPAPSASAFYLYAGARVPEPATFGLVLLGLGALALRSRKA